MATFRRRSVDPARVAQAEAAAALSPILKPPVLAQESEVGSRQPPGDQSAVSVASGVRTAVGPAPDSDQSQSADSNSNDMAGAVRMVPLHLIRSNPQPPREVYTAKMIDDMAISLRERGQNIAATGFLAEDGVTVVLIEGETRLRGARQAGLTHLRVEIKPRPANDQDLYEQARSANVDRRDQSPLDDALCWRRLLDQKVYPTQAALAKALGLDEDAVSNTLSLASIPRSVIRVVCDYPSMMTGRMLLALRRFCEVRGEDETIELIHEIDREGLGYRDVDSRRKAAEVGPVKRPRAQSEAITYCGCRGEIKVFNGGQRVELSLKGLKPEQADELATKLRSMFA